MNSWLIKLGKAISAIKNDGFFRGGKRVLLSAFSLFRPVGSGDILFIASGVGDSARYRCHHVAEELRFRGFKTAVTTQDNPFLSRYVEKFSVFVFHRTSWTPAIQRFIDALKEQKKTAFFDTDDLVFDGDLFKKTAAYEAMNALERKQYERGVGIEFLEDPFVAAVSTSTTFLAEKLRKFGKPVFVVPNRLSKEDVRRAKRTREWRMENGEWRKNTKDTIPHSTFHIPHSVVIGYFSGSTGHDRDFATVANVLVGLLEAHSNVRLFIGGPLSLPVELEKYSDRITRVSYVPRAEHFRNLSKIDINIAPLEIGDPFCEAKSELKFFEAGIFGVPTVAAATGTFREAIADGIDGFVARSEYEWRERLERLILDADLRKRIGEKARETVLKKYVTKSVENNEYVNFLRSRV